MFTPFDFTTDKSLSCGILCYSSSQMIFMFQVKND